MKLLVSTLSHPKAAARESPNLVQSAQRFNTQPRGGGCQQQAERDAKNAVSTHSRLKAAEPLSKALLHQVSQPRFR